jgi:hypothetical protein
MASVTSRTTALLDLTVDSFVVRLEHGDRRHDLVTGDQLKALGALLRATGRGERMPPVRSHIESKED